MEPKIVVTTGASAGIGAATAELLARRGDVVVLVARREDALRAAAARCAGRAHAIVADMTKRADARRVDDETVARHGRIDVWINNVGQGISRLPSELTDDDIDEIMRVNVKSALYGMQEVLPHFRSRNAGHIVNISSLLGRMPLAVVRSAYCGAKHFLNVLTATLRAELQETHPGIEVSLGGIDSRQLPYSQTAEEVAEVIAGVIDSRRPDVYTRKGAQAQVAAFYAGIGEDP